MEGQRGLDVPSAAVHRLIVCADVEGFADRRRTNAHQIAVRDGLYGALEQAFTASGVGWQECYHEDRGDGVLVLVPPEMPKKLVVTGVPLALAAALSEHNHAHDRRARIRLRLAVHAGEVHHDGHGVAGTAINLACRLVEAEALKRALGGSLGVLAVIASQWFYEEVIRHHPASAPASYRRVRISVKETQASAWICLPDDPYPPEQDAALPPEPQVAVPRQLPGAVAGFAGRVAELAALTGQLDQAGGQGGTVVIWAIGGTAGIGKTALAVRWAHEVAGRFPDGQLYVNLRGFDPAGSPLTAAEAVRRFLDAFDVPAERIPVSLDAQAALYRSLLAGRRVLVVLDNARDAGQIRPLLPGSPGCVVVVTSRNQLTSLITAEGAHLLALDLLSAAEARQLLARRLGPRRVAAEPQPVEEIIALCARLPLALSIVAARAATHPGFALAQFARELRGARSGLDAFQGGEPAADARAVFSWSYQQLGTGAARLFRLLSLHPGPDIAPPAAASMAGISATRVAPVLAELTRAHLLAEHSPGRFSFHDLLRAYAAEQAATRESPAAQRAALRRMLDHYLHTAHSAAVLLHPRVDPVTVVSPCRGAAPERLCGYAAAWAWFEAEYPVLLAAITQAAAAGFDTHAWQLPAMLEEYFRRRGHWNDWVAAQHTALTAARHCGDPPGQAHAHRGLGRACGWLGRHDEAHTHLQQALRLFEALGDRTGQANTYAEIYWVFEYQGRLPDALTHARQALALYRAAGHRRGQARVLNSTGWFHALLGEHQQALTCCQEALAMSRELGDRRLESHTLDSLGYAHHHLGHYQHATAHFAQALALRRDLGDRWGQATILDHLGDTQHAAGNAAGAHATWQQALGILDQLGLAPHACVSAGYPKAEQIRAKLHHLTPALGPDQQP